MREYTPGPWNVAKNPVEYDGFDVVAEIWGEGNGQYAVALDIDTEANARLIAAAPEMLEALKGFQEWWDEWYRNPNPTTVSDPPIDQARAAIAKAKVERHE